MSLIKKLAEATGKSADEIMEYFGKKAGQAPSVPMGSGKNLEALQKAKIGAPDADLMKYPRGIHQDDLAEAGDFTLVGSPQSKDFTMPHPEATVPTVRGNTLPQTGEVVEDSIETLPAVQGGALVPRSDNIPSVIETTSRQIPDDIMSRFKRMDPRLAGIAAASGLGLAGLSLMGEDETPVQIPYRREQPEETQTQSSEQMKFEEPIQEIAPVAKPQSAFSEAPEKEYRETYDFLNDLKKAQARGDENEFNNLMLRAANQIGAGIAGIGAGADVKANQSMVDALDKVARSSESNIMKQAEIKGTENRLKKMEKELGDDAKLRDPNSSVSKMTKDVLARHGLNVKNAKEAQLAGINIQNLILQEMGSAERKEIARMSADLKKSQKERQLTKDQQSQIGALRKELTGGNIGKLYNNVNQAARTVSLLEDLANNPSAFGDYGTLLVGLKGLQGDESVVRGEEMRLGMSATSMTNKLMNYVDRIKSGKTLQPEQRQDMIRSIKAIRDISTDKYKMAAEPILQQARDFGIDESYLLPEYLRGSSQLTTKASKSEGKTLVNKQYSPSRDKTRMIYSDGSEEIVDGRQ